MVAEGSVPAAALPGPHARIALHPTHPRGLAAGEGKESLWMRRKIGSCSGLAYLIREIL